MRLRLLTALFLVLFLSSCSFEGEIWKGVQAKGTIEAYQKFLQRYPRSRFSPQAAQAIERLRFRKASAEGTLRAYEDFLGTHPQGAFREEAQRRIEQLCFREADEGRTLRGYEDYLRRFSQGESAELAKARIRAIEETIAARPPAWKNVKTARIQLNLSFPEGVQLPFLEVAKRSVERAGITVIEDDTESADATLAIQATGSADGDKYGSLGFVYTGASLTGVISLKNRSGLVSTRKFHRRKEPDVWLNYVKGAEPFLAKSSPADAPFENVFFYEFPHCLLELLREHFGDSLLVFSLDDKDMRIKGSAAGILSTIRNPRTTELLIDALKHLDRDGRNAAAAALGGIKDPRAVEPLIGLLKFKTSISPVPAKNVIMALGKIGDARAVEPLFPFLHQKNSTLGEEAIDALAAIGDPRAIGPLIDALRPKKEETSLITYRAAEALGKMTGQKFGLDYQAWAGWWEVNREEFLKKK